MDILDFAGAQVSSYCLEDHNTDETYMIYDLLNPPVNGVYQIIERRKDNSRLLYFIGEDRKKLQENSLNPDVNLEIILDITFFEKDVIEELDV